MKITKRQLRRIIKEEKARLSEQPVGRPAYAFNQGVQGEYEPGESVLEDLMVAVDEAIDNAAGQIDLDYQDDPLSTRQVINFVMQSLQER
jgi:hypothetical protein